MKDIAGHNCMVAPRGFVGTTRAMVLTSYAATNVARIKNAQSHEKPEAAGRKE